MDGDSNTPSEENNGLMHIPFSLYGHFLYVPDGSVQLIRVGKAPLLVKFFPSDSLDNHWLKVSYTKSIRLQVFNTDTDSDESSESGCHFKIVGDSDSSPASGSNCIEIALYRRSGTGKMWTQFHPPGAIYVVNPGASSEDKRPWKIASHTIDPDTKKHTFTFTNICYQIGDEMHYLSDCSVTPDSLGVAGGVLYATISSDNFETVSVVFSTDGIVRSDDYFPVPLYQIDKDGNVLVDLRFCGIVMLA